MAKGRFNKRAGGERLDAQSAEEIELRNAKLEEVEEARAKRRAEAEEEENEGEGEEESEQKKESFKSESKGAGKKPDEPTGPVTTEADHKRNMAKLAEVRKRREEAEKRRKAEEEAAKQLEEERKKLAEMTTADGDDGKKKKKNSIPKLDKIAIKKMKPAQMKEHLKTRGLDIQGNAKQLQQRLLDYEAKR